MILGGRTNSEIDKTFTEEDEPEAEKAVELATKAKIMTEKAAFDFIKELPGI